MPHHKSCKKRIITAAKSNLRNRKIRSMILTATKKVQNATTKESADIALTTAYSVLDKAKKVGIIHKNNAANQKSRLSKICVKVTS